MNETFETNLSYIATDEDLHLAHLYIFSKMDQAALTLFTETWPTIDLKRRRNIVANLVEISEINFEVDFDPVFLIALGDDDAEVRAGAINGLWENENPDLIEPFLHLLHTDETALVRATAAIALGRFLYLSEIEELDPVQVEPIKGALLGTIYQAGEDIEVRRRAVEAIAFLSEPGINEIIESAYYDDSEKMRASAIFAMGRNADKTWRPHVLAELDNERNEIRFEAARACGELEISEAVPKLIALIDEADDAEVQEVCIWALGRIGGQTAREALEICTESDNEALALAAEESLEELNLFTEAFDMFDFESELDDLDLDSLEDEFADSDQEQDRQ
jgi:HEAT repeat protein